MKRLNLRRSIFEYVADNRLQYISVAVAILVGTALGAVSAVSVSGDGYESLSGYLNNFISAYNLQTVSRARIFETSMYNNIKLILFLWISGLWVGLIPFTFLQVGIKGYKVGFSAAFLTMAYKGKGALLALTALLPQFVILIPCLTVFAVFNIKYAMSLRKMRDMRNNSSSVKRDMYLRNFLCMTGITAVLAVCSFMDAYIVPTVLRPICALMF